MQGIVKHNGDMKNFLTLIDVFSKIAGANPVYSNNVKAITAVVEQVLKPANPRQSRRLKIDKGKEILKLKFSCHNEAL